MRAKCRGENCENNDTFVKVHEDFETLTFPLCVRCGIKIEKLFEIVYDYELDENVDN